jgi:hypothetical protein
MAKQIITALVRNGRLEYQADSKDILNKRIARLEGEYVSIEVKSLSPKTKQQLGYYYAVVLPAIIKEMNELGWYDDDGMPFDIDSADIEVKKICARLDGGQIMDKRDMTKEDASIFLDKVIKWATVKLHAYIPEPTHAEPI